jgi:hypothetical protein
MSNPIHLLLRQAERSRGEIMKTRAVFLVALSVPLAMEVASAATRTSASYSLTTETADAGGRRAASASYSHEGSLGGIAGVGAIVSPPQTVRHGYIGQLYDIAGLTLFASPASLNEGATRQLSAAAALDDGSSQPLAGTSVAWGVVSGPIASINPSGLATADVVYRNTPATVRGDYSGRSATLDLLVYDVNPDNFGSYAGDGLPDDWQVNHFGLNNANAAPGSDPDLDGQTNAFEHYVGTVPTDALSLFRLRIESVAGQPTHRNVIFSPRHASRNYSVWYDTEVDSGSYSLLTGTTTSDNGAERTVTDLNATNTLRFYRVRISWP